MCVCVCVCVRVRVRVCVRARWWDSDSMIMKGECVWT